MTNLRYMLPKNVFDAVQLVEALQHSKNLSACYLRAELFTIS